MYNNEIIRFAEGERDKWLNLRHQGIGSSEVGTLLGLNPFQTPYQLWRLKCGLDTPAPENTAMRRGHYMEDAVAQWWSDETGLQVIKASKGDWIIRSTERPYLMVSPDRTYWLSDHHSNDNKGILECKTTNRPVDKDHLPEHWFTQLQYQLGVAGLSKGHLAWIYAGRDFDSIEVDFDPDFFSWLVEEVDNFWNNNILARQEPSLLSSDDVLRKYNSHIPSKIVEIDDNAFQQYKLLMQTKDSIKQLEDTKSTCEDALKLLFLDAEAISYKGQILATWKKSKDSERFDDKRFRSEHPDIAKDYIVTKEGPRTFLTKKLKDVSD